VLERGRERQGKRDRDRDNQLEREKKRVRERENREREGEMAMKNCVRLYVRERICFSCPIGIRVKVEWKLAIVCE
jgi:hypothetical protein